MDCKHLHSYCVPLTNDTQPANQVVAAQRPDEIPNSITSASYSQDGQFLSLGDRHGYVSILQRNSDPSEKPKKGEQGEFMSLYHRFKSHESEFDKLKSVEVEAKINRMQWLRPTNAAQMILTTNDKTIALWKVGDRTRPRAPNPFAPAAAASSNGTTEEPREHIQKRLFSLAHEYHINSISLNIDAVQFLSADDLRINLWHLDRPETLRILDLKPANMDDLAEVISSVSFHPQECNQMMFASSKGSMKVGDMREHLRIENFSRSYSLPEEAQTNFFSEIVASLSDAHWSPCGRYILARDYLTLKIWDVKMEKKPLKVINLHEALRSRLCDLYENECIFDKFECAWTADAQSCITGSYKNQFKVVELGALGQTGQGAASKKTQVLHTFDATKSPKTKRRTTGLIRSLKSKGGKASEEVFDTGAESFQRKVLHVASHPSAPEVAVVSDATALVYSI